MGQFVVSKGTLWGRKSYPLAQLDGIQIQAGTIQAALGKAARLLVGQKPKGRKISRLKVEVVRINGVSHKKGNEV